MSGQSDELEVKMAQFEHLVETVVSTPNRFVCTCDRCRYGPQYRSVRNTITSDPDSGRPAA